MSRVTAKNTKPELTLRKYLFSKGYRYRLHRKDLPGKPDIVLPKYKTVIFVHGCFWHGHSCKKGKNLPKQNRSFWQKKIKNNTIRDKNNIYNLERIGWKVLIIWECEIKNEKKLDRIISETL